MYPCVNPRCKDGWIALAFPVFTTNHRGRPVVTTRVLCEECIGGIASCCDGAGSQQPELHCGVASAAKDRANPRPNVSLNLAAGLVPAVPFGVASKGSPDGR